MARGKVKGTKLEIEGLGGISASQLAGIRSACVTTKNGQRRCFTHKGALVAGRITSKSGYKRKLKGKRKALKRKATARRMGLHVSRAGKYYQKSTVTHKRINKWAKALSTMAGGSSKMKKDGKMLPRFKVMVGGMISNRNENLPLLKGLTCSPAKQRGWSAKQKAGAKKICSLIKSKGR